MEVKRRLHPLGSICDECGAPLEEYMGTYLCPTAIEKCEAAWEEAANG